MQPVLTRRFLPLVLPGALALAWLTSCSDDPAEKGDGDADIGADSGGTAGDGDAPGDGDGDGASTGGAVGDGDGDGDGTGGDSDGTGGSGTKSTYLYVGSGTWGDQGDGLVTVYKVDRAARSLSFVSEHEAGGLASYLAIDVERLRLFAADEQGGGVLSFTIDGETGQLSPNGAAESENHPVHLSLTGDGAHLLAANYNEGSVDVYPISTSGQAQTSVQTVMTGDNAHSIVLDDSSRVLVANEGSDTISRFTWDGGVLTPQNPQTSAHTSPRHITFDAGGRAYVVSEGANTVTAYTIESDGQLSLYWEDSRLPSGETGTGADVRVTPDGKFVYATNRDPSNTIVARSTLDGGIIEHESTRGTIPRSLAMDPQGEFVLVANHGDGVLAAFDIEETGELTHVHTEEVDITPYFVALVEL